MSSKAQQATAVKENKSTGNFLGTMSQEEKICYGLLALILFLVWYIRSNFLMIPFERDEGAYAYYGKLLLDGKLPYRDFYEQKLPGIFYFYAMIVAIFGSTVKELHIAFTVLNLITIVTVFFSLKKLFSPSAGVVGAITYALVSMTPSLSGFTIQAEHGVSLFSAIGILFYVLSRGNQKWYWYLLSGLAFGTAFMIKTTGLFMMFWGGLILVTDFVFSKNRNFMQLLKNAGLYIFGALIIIGILMLIILVKGTVDDMVFWVYSIPKYYVNRIPFEEGVKYFGYARDAIVQNYKFMWVHGLLAIAFCLFAKTDWKMKMMVVSLAACSFATIVPGYYFYGHYWIQLIPGLAILSGMTFHFANSILSGFIKNNMDKVRYAYLAIFCIMAFMHIQKNKSYYFNPNYTLIMRQVYGNNPFPETMDIANYMKTIMKPEDQVAVFGSEPEFFIYTDKVSPTRHVFFSTIVASIPEHKQFQREFAQDIEKAKPKYFIFYRHSVSLLVQANVDQYVFDWANKYLTDNYKVIGAVDMPDGQMNSTYAFGKDVETFQPKGQNVIYIFERKNS